MTLSTKVGKILSRQKNPDRFTLVSHFKPKMADDKDRGLLYFVIEILNSDPAMAKIAKRIESTVIEEYYTDFTSGIEALEKSLKRVNQELAQIADEGEVGWIGKINSVIASLEKDTLHITQTGSVETYLIREDQVSHVTEHMSSATEKPSPEHTYANVASGSVRAHDKLLIATSELFYHFSVDDLRRIVAKFSPASAANYIVKSLHREEVESINALILECIPEHEEEKNEDAGTTEWIGPAPTPAEEYVEKVAPALRFFKRLSSKGVSKSKEIYRDQIVVTVSKISEEASKKVNERLSQYQTGPTNVPDEIIGTATPQQDLPFADTPDHQSMIAKIGYIAGRNISSARDFATQTKERSQIFIIGSLVLILVLAASGSYSFQNKKSREQRDAVQVRYELVRTKTDAALKAERLGDTEKARELLIDAQQDIIPLLAEKYLINDISDLAKTIDEETEKLFNVQRYAELPIYADFSTFDPSVKIAGIFQSPAGLITFDRERKNLLRFNSELQSVEKVPTAYFEGQYQTMAENEDGTVVFATHNPNQVYAVSLTSLDVRSTDQVTGDAWPKITALSTYFKNIYALVPSEGQIYKHINLVGNFGAKTPYITDAGGVDLTKAVDLTIDGSIYVLMEDGNIYQYLSGAKTDWQISGLPLLNDSTDRTKTGISHLLSPVAITRDPLSGNLLVADAGARRVVVFNDEGVYQKQYVSDLFAQIQDMWVDANNGQFLVLSGSVVYQLPL